MGAVGLSRFGISARGREPGTVGRRKQRHVRRRRPAGRIGCDGPLDSDRRRLGSRHRGFLPCASHALGDAPSGVPRPPRRSCRSICIAGHPEPWRLGPSRPGSAITPRRPGNPVVSPRGRRGTIRSMSLSASRLVMSPESGLRSADRFRGDARCRRGTR